MSVLGGIGKKVLSWNGLIIRWTLYSAYRVVFFHAPFISFILLFHAWFFNFDVFTPLFSSPLV
jgi:hypothetical protein